MHLLRYDNLADHIRRQFRLRHESRNRTCGEEFGDIARRAGRDQDDHRLRAAAVPGQQAGKIEPGLVAERQIDEDDLRPQPADKIYSFSACAGAAEDALSLSLEKTSSNVYE
jgi:hypothetical protein